MQRSGLTSSDQLIVQDQLLEVMPLVEEANSISEALDRMVKFELMLVNKSVLRARAHTRRRPMRELQGTY
jgi:hypothetical protein